MNALLDPADKPGDKACLNVPVGLLGTGAQDGHLDFHTVPELCDKATMEIRGRVTTRRLQTDVE